MSINNIYNIVRVITRIIPLLITCSFLHSENLEKSFTAIIFKTNTSGYQCLLAELLVSDHPAGLALEYLCLPGLLDVILAQPHLQVRHVVPAQADHKYYQSLATLSQR